MLTQIGDMENLIAIIRRTLFCKRTLKSNPKLRYPLSVLLNLLNFCSINLGTVIAQ